MRRISPIPALLALPLALAACGAVGTSPGPTGGPGGATDSPTTTPTASPPGPSPTAAPTPTAKPTGPAAFDPANFGAAIDNPWFPLTPGTTLTYKGTIDGEPAVDVFTVTDKTIVIEGVTCTIIDDRLYLAGVLAEKTLDYYAQDGGGNVWYLGEDTAEFDEAGKVVSTEGTWRAGVDGAEAGIFMEADPTIGRDLRQEYYKGHAEDHFKVVSLTESVSVPYGTFSDAMRTEERTPLEPDVLDNKYYVRGVGLVREVTVKGGHEELALVKVESS